MRVCIAIIICAFDVQPFYVCMASTEFAEVAFVDALFVTNRKPVSKQDNIHE